MNDPASIGPDAIVGDLTDDRIGRVKSELEPGERPLWCGRPTREPPRSNTAFAVWSVIAAASLIAASVCLVTYSRDTRPDPTPRGEIPPLIFSGAVAFGFASIVVFFLAATVSARKLARVKMAGTLYALTDRRAIIWLPETRFGAVKVYTVPRGSIVSVHRLEYPDGSGDVLFRTRDPQSPESGPQEVSRFEGVSDVRRVEEQVRRTLVLPPVGAKDSD